MYTIAYVLYTNTPQHLHYNTICYLKSLELGLTAAKLV